MKYTKTIKNLGISAKDFKILNALNDVGHTKILPLEEVLCIPRTTISYRLRNMSERDLVERIKIKNHLEWQLTDYSKSLFLKESGKEEFKVTYYNNLSDINKIIEKIMKDKTRERIYFIEPYEQTKKYIGLENTENQSAFMKLFKKEKNISEGITSDKTLELLKNYDKKVLRSMLGRMVVVYTIPDQYLSFEDYMIVYKDVVYIFNFDKKLAIEIESVSFAKSIQSLILALQSFGNKIDLNKYIKQILTE